MTQVDEKGHEGNTAVVIAYLYWTNHGQRNSRTGARAHYYQVLFTSNTLLYSYSNPAEYYQVLRSILFTLTTIMLVQLWIAGEGPAIEWSYLPRKIVREKSILPRSWRLIVSCCTKSGHMSRKLVSGKCLSITKQCLTTLTTFKILHIT